LQPESAIIMLSERNSEEDEVPWTRPQAPTDYIAKPFSLEVLMARIRATVRGRRELQENGG
jgi:DNA-binding response OmpR family regulator